MARHVLVGNSSPGAAVAELQTFHLLALFVHDFDFAYVSWRGQSKIELDSLTVPFAFQLVLSSLWDVTRPRPSGLIGWPL